MCSGVTFLVGHCIIAGMERDFEHRSQNACFRIRVSTTRRRSISSPIITANICCYSFPKLPMCSTWQSKPSEVSSAVEVALRAGYRHIDTAAAYQNEAEIGQIVQKFLGDGTIERKDVFITTKLS